MQKNAVAIACPPSKDQHIARLFRELVYAVSRTPKDELVALLLLNFPKDVVLGVFRRGRNILALGTRIVSGTVRYGHEALIAKKLGLLGAYCRMRGANAFSWATDKAVEAKDIVQRVRDDPQKEAIRFVGFALAALASSGGIDANGGLPDTDIDVLGIGDHRSPLTHSVLTGASIEAAINLLILFVLKLHSHLPENHSPVWDEFKSESDKLMDAISRGVSVGLAYHLLVDGLVQVAPYHDLPVPLPVEVHQAGFVVNGVAEAQDAAKRNREAIYKEFSSFEQASAYAKAEATKSNRSVQTVRHASVWRVVVL